MASSYTGNSGIEKPAQGDQTGEWGTTINTNMDIIDRSINGVLALTLTGTTTTVATTDGTLTDGMYKVLVLGGSPSGTNTITITPNDADKLYFVVNSSGQTATFTQGSGANVNVLNGDTAVIYCDGAGSGAAVADFTKDLGMSSVNIDGGSIDGVTLGTNSAVTQAVIDNININGATIGHTSDTDLMTLASGIVTVAGEVSMTTLDIGGTNVTSTATELNKLDGATVTATEINYLDITTLGTSEASKAVTVDASGDLLVPDSDKFKFGAGSDMQVYHDGTNSYVTNATGELKLATESSGIAIAIGHSTSEVTFGDNVTVTGNFDVNGTTTTIDTTNLTVTDPLVKFGQGYTGSAYDEGFIVTRGNGSASNTANKGLIWDESADEFAAIACNTEDGTTAGNVTINSYADLQVAKLTGASLDIEGDADINGTLEADAMTLNGTAITATATLSTGISNTNVPVFTSGVADDDFLRVAGTSIEGRSAAEVLSDIGASAVAGSGSIVTTGALNSGSITSGFGAIDNGSSAITTTGVITGGTVEATTDTAAGDNAAIGYTSAEGLILTGQGSTSDVTIKNDADATVLSIPTGTTKVGIGLTNPAYPLDVYGVLGIKSGESLSWKGDAQLSAAITGEGASPILKFWTSVNERMRIGAGGLVQIQAGSAAPNGEFFRIGTNSVGSVPVMSASFAGNARWLFNTNDTVGQSGGRHHTYFSNGGEVGAVTTTTSATTYATSSDYRLKENVNYSWDATTRLKQLKPARFNFKVNADSEIVDGFLAHEVSSIVPEAITGEKDGMKPEVLYVEGDELPDGKSVGDVKESSAPDYQGIDQSKLVPLLVKTIQELEARITALEAG